MQTIRDSNKLHIFIEGRRRKAFVGILESKPNKKFIFCYDKKYLKSESSIPLGPDIPLNKIRHESEGKLFPSFKDRIPSRKNPAYEDYCKQEGISPKEKNPIILLGTIGKRGPSSFIFESLLIDEYDLEKELNKFKEATKISIKDIAIAFDVNYVTLHKIMKGQSSDSSTGKLIRIYLSYPKCLSDQLKVTSSLLHYRIVESIIIYLEKNELT